MDKIPDRLFLQMDNCWRENKNQYVIVFLAVLIYLDIFKKVKVNFLMKGHTHEDCDQLFSRYGVKLGRNDVVTVDDLLTLFKECYTPAPVPVLLEEMFDVHDWLKPINPQLHNISNPHVFVLTKNATGAVVLRYKKWGRGKEWSPNIDGNNGIEILNKDTRIPTEPPNFVHSSPENVDMERLHKDIPKFLNNSRVITDAAKAWWADFFDRASTVYSSDKEKPKSWLLDELKVLKFGSAADGVENATLSDSDVTEVPTNESQEISEMVSAQQMQEIPEIYTGRYRPPGDRQHVTEVNDIWQHVSNDSFVAVAIENSTKVPVIGKVLEKRQEAVLIHYWKGSWNKKWAPWLNVRKPWTDELPKECIYLADFHLDAESKLQKATKHQMKQFLQNQA